MAARAPLDAAFATLLFSFSTLAALSACVADDSAAQPGGPSQGGTGAPRSVYDGSLPPTGDPDAAADASPSDDAAADAPVDAAPDAPPPVDAGPPDTGASG